MPVAHAQFDKMLTEAVKNFYNKNAAIIKNNYQPYNAVVLDQSINQHFMRLFSFADVKSDCKILDIGCGNGSLLNELSKNYKNCELHGLDISEKQLLYLQGVKTYCIDIEKFETNEKFDYIFCMEMIGYVKNQTETIDKILSMLNKNGTFICSSFIYEDLDTWQRDITKYKISSNNKEDCYYYNQISRNEIKKYKIEEYSKNKIANFYYLNFAEKRGLSLLKEEVCKKHILFKIKA